jgi:hypothetical protein
MVKEGSSGSLAAARVDYFGAEASNLQTKFTPGAVNQSSVAKIENFRALVG